RPFDPISGPFQGVLPPSGPRIMGAEETTHFLAQRKRGWPLSTLFLDTAALPPLATTPPSAGTSGVRPCADPPADYCMQPTAKTERGPIATSGPSLLDVHFVTRSSVLIDLDYSGSLWERGSSCTKITLGAQAHGCSPCRCLSRTLFVCPIHSVPNSRP